MSFTVARPTFLDAPQQAERQPGFMEMLGAGMGQGIAGGIQQQVKQSAMNQVLQQAQPGMAATDVFRLGSQLPEEQQQPFYAAVQARDEKLEKEKNKRSAKNASNFMAHNIKPGMSSFEQFQVVSQLPPEEQPYGFAELDKIQKSEKMGAETDKIRGETSDRAAADRIADRQILNSILGDERVKGEGDEKLDAEDRETLLKDIRKLSPAQKKKYVDDLKEQKKEAKEELDREERKGEAVFKRNENFIESVNDKRDTAKTELREIKLGRKLNQSKDINDPWTIKAAYASGRISGLTDDTIELDKNLSRRLQRAQEAMGRGIMTNVKLRAYEKSIPTIMQSASARDRLFDAMEIASTADIAQATAYDEIMKGRSYPPTNIRELVSSRTEEIRDEIYDKFDTAFRDAVSTAESESDELEGNDGKKQIAKEKPEKSEKGGFLYKEENDEKPEEPGFMSKAGTVANKFLHGEPLGEKSEIDKASDKYLVKAPIRIASRIVEKVAGWPSDLITLADDLAPGPRPEDVGSAKEIIHNSIKEHLPTSENLKKISEWATGGATKAQSPTEEYIDEIVGTAALLRSAGIASTPKIGSKAAELGLNINFGKLAKIIGAGEVGKHGSSIFTDSPLIQEGTRTAFMLAASIADPASVKNLVSSLFAEAEELSTVGKKLPKIATPRNMTASEKEVFNKLVELRGSQNVRTKSLIKNLKSIEKEIKKGGAVPQSRASSLKAIEQLTEKFGSGVADINDITAAKRNINEISADLWKTQELSTGAQKNARMYLDKIRRSLDNTINEYGEKNPAFLKKYRAAESAFQAEKAASRVTDFISETAQSMDKKWFAGKKIFKSLGNKAKQVFAPIEALVKYAKDKTWAKYYNQTIAAAAKQNVPSTTSNLISMSKRTEELDKLNKKRNRLYDLKIQKREEAFSKKK